MMRGRTVLITGGSSGIGRETALGLARLGATVIVAARDEARGQRVVEQIRSVVGAGDAAWVQLDLASLASIRACAGEVLVRWRRIDVLVNNAAVISAERCETEDGLEQTLGVNHLGHFLLTSLLVERLAQSAPARIINLSSTLHWFVPSGLDFADLESWHGYDGLVAYARSKLANIHFTRELARRLDPARVTANSLCPGMVDTRQAGGRGSGGVIGMAAELARPFSLSAAAGARAVVRLANSAELAGQSGRHWLMGFPALVSWAASDRRAARRLWEASETLLRRGGDGGVWPASC
jgi:NAD(P)-dependent dehydrogenase (short-subunit alcohol dehydrogenase family)